MTRARNSTDRRWRRSFAACGAVFLLVGRMTSPATAASSNAATSARTEAARERLELLDGSILHGHLRGMDFTNGLQWDYPAARQPIAFRPDNLAWIRFQNENPSAVSNAGPICQFQFANGDEFFGKLLSLGAEEMELQTWFAGTFKTPRSTVRSIRFFPDGATTLYEGPNGLDGWKVGRMPNPAAWRYEDGAFVAEGAGTIGRDFNLPDASRVEFDLAWSAPFSLLFSFYTSVLEGFNYNSSSYMFYMTAGNISLQRINPGSGSTTIGRTELIPAMLTKRKVHLEFRGNKDESLLELLADGQPVARWKDSAGWVGKGSGILFYSQTEGGLKISNIKVSSWDGKPGPEGNTNKLAHDEIYLANRDKVSGTVGNLRDGKLEIASAAAPLQIPLQRITQISFADARTNSAASTPWEIQASVSGGGTISFALEHWDARAISGSNRNFGRISLNPKSIRQIQFNLDKPKSAENQPSAADEIIWEAVDE